MAKSTKYSAMLHGEPGDVFMSQNTAEFTLTYDHGFVCAFEKRHVKPRAYFVPRARALDSPEAVPDSLRLYRGGGWVCRDVDGVARPDT